MVYKTTLLVFAVSTRCCAGVFQALKCTPRFLGCSRATACTPCLLPHACGFLCQSDGYPRSPAPSSASPHNLGLVKVMAPHRAPLHIPQKSLHPFQSLLDSRLARLRQLSQHDRHTRARNETAKTGESTVVPQRGAPYAQLPPYMRLLLRVASPVLKPPIVPHTVGRERHTVEEHSVFNTSARLL